SPGKILSIKIPTFEALSQFGTATITTKNIGELEASYSLTVCLLNLNPWASIVSLSKWCKLHGAHLLRMLQIVPADELKKNEINSFFEAIKGAWSMMWSGLVDFFTGRICRCTKQRNRINSKHPKDVKKPGLRHQKEKARDVHHKHTPIPSHDGKKPKSSHSHRVPHKHIHLCLAENDRYHLKHDSHLHLDKVKHKHKHKHNQSYLAQSHKSNRNRPVSMEMGDMKHKITRCRDEKDSRHKHVYHQLYGANSHEKDPRS
ncbi:hypothetical protein B296_00031470, partial [Ensete ventricosum]